jgi:hypothetical protein
MRAMLPSGCHVQERKNLRLHDLQASGEGEEDMNIPIGPAAFVFKHKRTGQIVVVPNERWHELYDKQDEWEHTASLNACGALQYIIDAKPAERKRYIKRLTEKA